MRLTAITWALLAAFFIACSGDDEPEATPTPQPATATATTESPTAAPEATVVPISTPEPTATEAPSPGRISGAWLFDIATGTAVVIPAAKQENHSLSVWFWTEDTVRVDEGSGEARYYDLEGNEVSEPARDFGPSCEGNDDGAVVAGREYADVSCGPVSPDGRWMTYRVVTGQTETSPGYAVDVWDQWAVNLETDERQLLQDGLVHCGGCDGRFGPGWSPDSRFLYFSELVSQGRVFLSDVEAGTTQLLFEGSTEVGDQPLWSPDSRLLHTDGAGSAVLNDPAVGSVTTLSAPAWPACFDTTGALVYGPAAGDPPEIVIYSIAQGQVFATLSGNAGTNGNGGFGSSCASPPLSTAPVVSTKGGFVALLSDGSECAGAVVYRNTTEVACVEPAVTDPRDQNGLRGSLRTALSPVGKNAAVARMIQVGEAPPCTENPCGQATIEALYQDPSYNPAFRDHSYEVLLVDTATGATTALVTDASGNTPPFLAWNDAGTHLLVRWPYETAFGP